jgi:hypothetical protein
MRWPTVSLGEICIVDWGNTSLTKSSYVDDGEYLAVSATGGDGRIGHCEHKALTPVISAIGAQCGKLFLPREDFTAIKNTITLTPINHKQSQEACCPVFLYHLLSSVQLPRRGAGQPFISKGDLQEFKITLPPLEEQRRIAAILDKANQLRQLSRGNLQTLDALVKKVFSDMFGDPISNERDWNSGCIGDFIAKFETGKSLGSGEGDVSDSLRIIKVSAVSSGDFKPEESKPAPKGYVPPPNHFVQEGDLLFCRANTDMLIGEVAYVGHGVQDLLLSDSTRSELGTRQWPKCKPVHPTEGAEMQR